VLVFTRTKHGANRLSAQLMTDGITASAIHGNKSQGARTKALAEFKSGKVRVLVATDIAARALDINELPHVVNFELPNVAEDYVHRIGRTGRAGKEGEAMSLVCVDELGLLKDIERLIKSDIPKLVIAGFEPDLSIKPEPINKGRGRQQQSARRPAGNNAASPRNGNHPPFKGRSNNQNQPRKNRSQNRARQRTSHAA
jgi:ATP-dependent RNA helicase RhlE